MIALGAADLDVRAVAAPAATLVTAAAVAVATAVWLRTRSWSPAVPILLELLLAAGLLRLSAQGSWHAIAAAAAIVAVRTLVKASASWTVSRAGPARTPPRR